MWYYYLASLGLVFILKYGTILQPLRTFFSNRIMILHELFRCGLCLGFWCGVLLAPIMWLDNISIYKCGIYPFVSACVCWFGDGLMEYLQEVLYQIKNS